MPVRREQHNSIDGEDCSAHALVKFGYKFHRHRFLKAILRCLRDRSLIGLPRLELARLLLQEAL